MHAQLDRLWHASNLYRTEPAEDAYALGKLGSGLAGTWITPLHAAAVAGILADGRSSGERWDGLDPGTVMGHIHLQTQDLPATQRFYVERLGFDVIQSDPQVTFMSVAGYHHHVAVNAWHRKRHAAAPEAGGIGLLAGDSCLAPDVAVLGPVTPKGGAWADPSDVALGELMTPDGVRLPGRALAGAGLQAPVLFPERLALLRATRV